MMQVTLFPSVAQFQNVPLDLRDAQNRPIHSAVFQMQLQRRLIATMNNRLLTGYTPARRRLLRLMEQSLGNLVKLILSAALPAIEWFDAALQSARAKRPPTTRVVQAPPDSRSSANASSTRPFRAPVLLYLSENSLLL